MPEDEILRVPDLPAVTTSSQSELQLRQRIKQLEKVIVGLERVLVTLGHIPKKGEGYYLEVDTWYPIRAAIYALKGDLNFAWKCLGKEVEREEQQRERAREAVKVKMTRAEANAAIRRSVALEKIKDRLGR